MGARGRLENAAWILGVTLMLTYGAARVWAERERETAIAAFENARLLQASQSSHPLRSSMQAGRGVDQSLWSPQRIAAYAAAPHDTHDVKNVPIALLRIPDVQLEVPVFNGTGEASLNRGAGHIEGTARPGESGNSGIAAHRDGFFRKLKDVEIGQSLLIETSAGTAHYRIVETRVVGPSDVAVLAPTPQPVVTLVTCYPFYFVGSAPQRFVVRAERVRSLSVADAASITAGTTR